MSRVILAIVMVVSVISCTPEEEPCFKCEVIENSNGELVANCWQIECDNG